MKLCTACSRGPAESERRRGPVVGHSLWTRPARVQSPWEAIIIRCKNRAVLKRGRTHHGPHDGPRSSILKRVRHLRTAGQGHIANDALEMISCNEFSYSHATDQLHYWVLLMLYNISCMLGFSFVYLDYCIHKVIM